MDFEYMASELEALLDQIDNGELEATEAERAYIEGAAQTLRTLAEATPAP